MKVFITLVLSTVSFSILAQPLSDHAFQFVNNAKDELNPVISPDGNTLFVTLANHPENVGGIKDPGDIWISVRTEGNQWSAPVHGGPIINSKDYNAVAGGKVKIVLQPFSPLLHLLDAFNRFQGPNQDSVCNTFLVGNNIKEMVNAITQINVCMPTVFKHHGIPFGFLPAIRMTPTLFPGIGLGFHNHSTGNYTINIGKEYLP